MHIYGLRPKNSVAKVAMGAVSMSTQTDAFCLINMVNTYYLL